MHSTGYFAACKKTGNICLAPLIYPYTAHHMMRRWSYLHRLFTYINTKLQVLLKHQRKAFLYNLRRKMRNIKVYSPLLSTPALSNFSCN